MGDAQDPDYGNRLDNEIETADPADVDDFGPTRRRTFQPSEPGAGNVLSYTGLALPMPETHNNVSVNYPGPQFGSYTRAVDQDPVFTDENFEASKFMRDQAERDRNESHAHEVPPPGQRGYPDVYINGSDVDAVTVTVDPVSNSHWIIDDSYAKRNTSSANRGALKDHAAVVHTVKLLNKNTGPFVSDQLPTDNLRSFIPTSNILDNLDKFSPKCLATSTHGRKTFINERGHQSSGDRYGKLPYVSAMIYRNALRDVVDYQINDQLYLAQTHANRDRSFDCSGNWRIPIG